MRFVPFARFFAILAAVIGSAHAVNAQTIGSSFAASYSIQSLGPVANLPFTYGGLTFKAGDPNTLLIGGNSDTPGAAIYSVAMQRDANRHVTNFASSAVFFANAYGVANSRSQGGIDGGLAYASTNVLFYTSYKDNGISQLVTGATNASAQTDLTPLGVNGSVGALAFVPQGFPGAGHLKILSYDNNLWYDTTISLTTNGTYKIAAPTNPPVSIDGTGPEGAVYVAGGNPGFTTNSVLLSEFQTGEVGAYAVDSNGDIVVASRQTFITDLQSVEGAAIDPLTGDFLFSTAGINPQVYVVSGFTINPSDVPPVVHLTSPTPTQSLTEPANITLTASATDADGTVKSVEYFGNGASLGSSTNSPYRVDWKAVPAGSYTIVVKATDDQGAISYSDPVTITVATAGVPPTVSLTALSQTNLTAGTNLTLSATAQDSDGKVVKVDFQANGVSIGTSTNSPYSIVWSNLQTGSYTLTAVATDNSGLTTTSAPISIRVAPLNLDKLIGTFQAGSGFQILIGTDTNKTYEIDASTNLVTWTKLTNIVTGTNTSLKFIDPASLSLKMRFYRAQKQ